jgi:hypothetical protein
MVEARSSPPTPDLNWFDIGQLPPALDAKIGARADRRTKVISWVSGFFVGGAVAAILTFDGPGISYWPVGEQVAFFFGVGIPIGFAEFFLSLWILSNFGRASKLRVQRVAVFDGRLMLEQTSGQRLSQPLDRVEVAADPTDDGWYEVILRQGRFFLSFYVAPALATTIQAAQSGR